MDVDNGYVYTKYIMENIETCIPYTHRAVCISIGVENERLNISNKLKIKQSSTMCHREYTVVKDSLRV